MFEACVPGKACITHAGLANYILNREGNADWMNDAWTLCKPKPEVEETNDENGNHE